MTLTLDHRVEAPEHTSVSNSHVVSLDAQRPHLFLPGWPLVASLIGLPIWWLLGLSQLIYFVTAIPMIAYLLRIRTVATPRGFNIWLLFLGWVLAGTTVLWVTAPGTLDGGRGAGPLLTFGYRFGWYVIATVAMLYVVNTKRTLSTSRITGALAAVFLTLVAGGYLGLLIPRLEFATPLEVLLPQRLTQNTFVRDLVHAQAAQVQTFLGNEDARPSAPFTYTNLWGLNIALTLPFFVAEWWSRGGRQRTAVFPVLAVAAIPIIFSLNRGLWGAVLLMMLFFALRSALTGRFIALIAVSAVGLVAAVAIFVSPAGDLIAQRLDNPHSNEGRESLGFLAVESTLEGSPFIGFGTTREVAGNFNSITGGESEACPRCSPPPLGTQGQLWLLIFGSGFGGLVLYVAFFGSKFWRHFRNPSPYAVASLCSILVLFVTMPVYNSVGFGIFVASIAVGLLGREEATARIAPLNDVVRRLLRNTHIVVACAAVGGMAGVALQVTVGSNASATQSVLVPPADLTGTSTSRALTLDTEALIATSEPVLLAVQDAIGSDSIAEVRTNLSMSAEANSQILKFTYRDHDPTVAALATQVAATKYLTQRRSFITAASESLQQRLDVRLRSLDESYERSIGDLPATQGSVLPSALATLRVRADASVARLASNAGDTEVEAGRTLASPVVNQSTDDWFVRAGSGVTLGTFAGLMLMRPVDRRRNRLGTRPDRKLAPFDLPTIARVAPAAARSGSTDGLLRAQRATRSYFPVAGVLADPGSSASRALANELDHTLEHSDQRRGSRVVVVAESSSRVDSVMELLRSCERNGIEPVGLVYIG